MQIGRYEIVEEVASGGMASVSLARLAGPAGFERLIALKCVHPHLAKEREFVEMFLDEARVASRIRHPNVCSVFDVGSVDGHYYLAMDFLDGVSLSALFKAWMRDPSATPTATRCLLAARIVSEAAAGLHAAHELQGESGPLNVVHRDVSPQNLFVTWEGHVQVVDFGIARATGRLYQTASSVLKGKLAYMSPEQVRDSDVDRRTDVWALGVVLHELLCSRRLFRRRTEPGTMNAILQEDIPQPSSIDPGVPDALDAIVARCLCRDPEDRYPTTRAIARDLDRFLSSQDAPIGAVEISEALSGLLPEERATSLERMRRARSGVTSGSLRRSKTPLWLPIAVGLIGVGVTLVGFRYWRSSNVDADPTASAQTSRDAGSRDAVALADARALPDTSALPDTHALPGIVVAAPDTGAIGDDVEGASSETLGLDLPVRGERVAMMAARMVTVTSDMATGTAPTMVAEVSEMAPTMVAEVSEMATEVAAGPGLLRVVTPGGWADLSVDGVSRGRTPAGIELPSGTHRVVLTFPDGTVVRREVSLSSDGARVRVPAP